MENQARKPRPDSEPGRKSEDRTLNKALIDTFPASDPVADNKFTGREEPPSRIDRRPPVLPTISKDE